MTNCICCGEQATQKCGICYSVYYCGTACAEQDQLFHKQNECYDAHNPTAEMLFDKIQALQTTEFLAQEICDALEEFPDCPKIQNVAQLYLHDHYAFVGLEHDFMDIAAKGRAKRKLKKGKYKARKFMQKRKAKRAGLKAEKSEKKAEYLESKRQSTSKLRFLKRRRLKKKAERARGKGMVRREKEARRMERVEKFRNKLRGLDGDDDDTPPPLPERDDLETCITCERNPVRVACATCHAAGYCSQQCADVDHVHHQSLCFDKHNATNEQLADLIEDLIEDDGSQHAYNGQSLIKQLDLNMVGANGQAQAWLQNEFHRIEEDVSAKDIYKTKRKARRAAERRARRARRRVNRYKKRVQKAAAQQAEAETDARRLLGEEKQARQLARQEARVQKEQAKVEKQKQKL